MSSASASTEVAAVEGLFGGLDKKLLRPLFELELTALRTLALSETKEGRLLGIVEEDSESGLGNRAGVTSQWARKYSPRTELYSLQTLPCCW